MKRRSVSIALTYIVLCFLLMVSGYLYFDLNKRHANLQSDHISLVNACDILQSDYQGLELDYRTLNNTHYILNSSHTRLNQTHKILILEYNELNASYEVLTNNHTELEQDYSELYNNYTALEHNHTGLSNEFLILQNQYTSLFNDYDALLEAFNEPLPTTYEEVPSIHELEQWLAIDETDEIRYDEPDFLCGDFAVMLSLHAKLERWDIGVVGVVGYTESLESFAHAFNAIICDEGLIYIEPQSDEIWSYGDHEEIGDGDSYHHPGFGEITVEEYIVVTWYS
ncbi:MAG: hypothetical protein JSW53_00750 [Candidatus Bathyarchaeota archaeon]|nr:MAG: hypothetical protein JSW53_00750 [Candidatus Bathyarchaeota archaeon]